MLINGNRLVELTPTELSLLRELVREEAADVKDGTTFRSDWTVIDLTALEGRLDG